MNRAFSLVELSIVLLKQILSLRGALATKQSMDCRTQASPSFAMTGGFSLVELSIVLVILGLLTGGILTGQNLIRNAELRSVVTEFQAFQTAVYTFRDKYFALPGDMANAYDFWGVAVGCTDVDVNSDVNGCNGDGDGMITSVNNGESARAWQHLANARLVEGQYSGITGTSPDRPNSKLGTSKWNIKYFSIDSHGWTNAPDHWANQLYFSASNLPAEEAWSIDTKMDDGKANGGHLFAHTAYGCVTGTDWTSDDYDLTADNNCHLLFMLR